MIISIVFFLFYTPEQFQKFSKRVKIAEHRQEAINRMSTSSIKKKKIISQIL